MGRQLGRHRFGLALITRRRRVLAYSLDGLAMEAKQARGFPLATLIDHDGASDFDIEFH